MKVDFRQNVMPWMHHAMRYRGLPLQQGVGVFLAPKHRGYRMRKRPLDPDVADTAPVSDQLTSYDEQHIVTYFRLLDAYAENADWKEVARIVLHIDPEREPRRARRAWESHLARAKWMTERGYRHLLRYGWSMD